MASNGSDKVLGSTQQITGPGGLSFFTKSWSPKETYEIVASIIFVHGFVEHIRRYEHVFSYFAEQGIAVFGYDQRGFGQTAADLPGGSKQNQGVTSWANQLEDMSFFINHASTLHPSVPLFLMGHSMGGGLSIAYATRSPPLEGLSKIKAVIASSPWILQAKEAAANQLVVAAGSFIGKLNATMKLPLSLKGSEMTRDAEIAKQYAEDPLCKQQGTFKGVGDCLVGGQGLLKKDYQNWPNQLPLLIVHGEADKVTSADASKEFVDKITKQGAVKAEYKGFPGFYHEMHNEPGDDKWQEIHFLADWIKSNLN